MKKKDKSEEIEAKKQDKLDEAQNEEDGDLEGLEKEKLEDIESKKETLEDEEEADLEQIVEHLDEIDLSEFQKFMINQRPSSPSLTNINASPSEPVVLERNVEESSHKPVFDKDKNPSEYEIGGFNKDDDQAEYTTNTAHMNTDLERVDMQNVGRNQDQFPNLNQEAMSMRHMNQDRNSSNIENYTTPKNFDIDKAGRENPQDLPQEKYDLSKNLPKH